MFIIIIGLVILIIWQYSKKIDLYRDYCESLSEQKKQKENITELEYNIRRLKSRIQYIKTYGNDFHND